MKITDKIRFMLIGYSADFADAFHYAKKLGHDPFKNHDIEDKVGGKSYFGWTPHKGILPIYYEDENSSPNKDTKKFLFWSPNVIGRDVRTYSMNPDAEGVVENYHGCLQVMARSVIPWTNVEIPTNIFSLILTLETIPGETEKKWVAASCHPGAWDVDNVTDILVKNGKKESDILSFKEMSDWGILSRVIVK